MKNRTMHVVLIALTLLSLCAVGGVVGFGMLASFFLQPSAPPPQAQIMMPVVVAAVDLPAGTVLDDPDRQLVLQPFAPGTTPPNACTDPEELRGQTLTVAIDRGFPVLALHVTRAAPPVKLEPGLRAVTITVNLEQALAGFILPGSRVDIVATAPDPEKGNRQVTRTIVPDVQVLAVDTKPAQAGKVAQITFQITVALAPDDAQTVAQAKGTLSIVLRRPKDAD